jgi:hypothetical protein
MPIQLSDANKNWSGKGLRLAICATIASVFFALADGVFHGPLNYRYAGTDMNHMLVLNMLGTWSYDLRQVCEELIFVGVVLFIGAKFFETRSIFSVGFDKTDAARMTVKGPDDDNIVWIGHKYGSRLEAESVAAMMESRLKNDAA